jgi:5,10-methylene-tetrahydrofolate dehydrogenase/methenyl tetrahydrofolate cyclohydrolase
MGTRLRYKQSRVMTPLLGGVGPLTNVVLLKHACRRRGIWRARKRILRPLLNDER